MNARKLLLASAFAVAALGLCAGGAFAQWKPTKTISVVVPWPAGGASDTVGRMIAGTMEQLLGQRMVIVNTAGGAGAIGTKEVWDKPHDGYTLTANSTVSIGSYAVLGKLDQTHRDWRYYLPIFTPKKAAPLIAKVLKSAVANAGQKKGVDVDALVVKRILIDQGPTLKRFHARAMGRGARILHRLSHITVAVDE